MYKVHLGEGLGRGVSGGEGGRGGEGLGGVLGGLGRPRGGAGLLGWMIQIVEHRNDMFSAMYDQMYWCSHTQMLTHT